MARLVVGNYNKKESFSVLDFFPAFLIYFCSISDKNLLVSISGDVDEAKALSKPPDDSQGTNFTIRDHQYQHSPL